MPRSVDRNARRTEVAQGLIRIVARDGMEAVSVRAVAAEAGVSAGAVQRYFSSKDELLHFALRYVVDATMERLNQVRIGPQNLPLAEGLRQVFLDLAPFDPQRLAEARIWAAFEAKAAVNPEFAKVRAELDDEARARMRRILAYAESTGQIAPGQDLNALADLVIVLIDGLSWTGMRWGAGGRDALTAAIDAAVALLTRDAPGTPPE